MVEQEFEDCPTTFTYLASVPDEVASILPVLPLFLTGRLCKDTQAWFLPSHNLGTGGTRRPTGTDTRRNLIA
jgi:hypothetical protein